MIITNEEELMLCAWCQLTLVSVKNGYCSKQCHDDDRKANESEVNV